MKISDCSYPIQSGLNSTVSLRDPNILTLRFLIHSMSILVILHAGEIIVLQELFSVVMSRLTILYIVPIFNSYRCLKHNDEEGIKKLLRFW